ncbi:cytochrome C [Microbacterium sp. TS-1]|jgi:ubiquinol-cytochrome c reductase cytochrome c subunit|uniref:Cytochrome bc1 complex cytochrome c subunit n=1 Tax=Microbacterium paludicola TaxID=300019 RepID=A0ABU1HX24_9MICO|nr:MULTISPECIES: cytochrome c [Microbacterium]APF33654.1 cystathionine beta-lyase [Microbacterium paludicola]MDR6165975.1 ubiquinol-cytochrome c reductase cytochrome c subunit [Microbacterium paludicola]QCR40012.1 cystathionine beta-lyase [Microbacterium sp. SGAir0570]GAD33372.1 cytochrome C [Microbacterium sp. TS-1]
MASKNPRRNGGRRSKWAAAALIGIGLLVTGGGYAGATAAMAAGDTTQTTSTLTVEDGKKLFQANCATCHGLDLQGTNDGPSLYGVGELSVEFQVATGRMPLQMQGPQAPQKPVQFTQEQIEAMAAWVQSEAPGPTYPESEVLDGEGDVSHGAELFRINCAMCHNVAGAGGALTEGKYAPPLTTTSPLHMYAAMVTGPQNMPVFNDMTLTTEEKRDIISYLMMRPTENSPGGFSLGSLGPVSEGLFIWIFGIGSLVAISVWITAKSN